MRILEKPSISNNYTVSSIKRSQKIQHKGLYEQWKNYSLPFQMGNIGSEVSRALKNRDKPNRFQGCFDRALELFDFTIDSLAEQQRPGALREVCRAREEFCDYFNGNTFHADPEKMQRYYDQFALLANKDK